MKRYLLVLLPCFCWAVASYAQPENTTPTWGFRVGPGFSRVVNDEALDDHARRFTAAAGFFGNFYFSERLSLQAEIDLLPGGARFSSHDITMHLTYLQVPFMARYAFFDDPKVYLVGGVYGGYLLGAKTQGLYTDLEREEQVNEDIGENLKSLDYGICLGLGVQGRFNSRVDIFAELRFHQGMRNIVKQTGEERYNLSVRMRYPFEYNKPKHQATLLSIGCIFYLYER